MKKFIFAIVIGTCAYQLMTSQKAHALTCSAPSPPSSYSNATATMANMDNFYPLEPRFDAPQVIRDCIEIEWQTNGYNTLLSATPLPPTTVNTGIVTLTMMEMAVLGKDAGAIARDYSINYVGSKVLDSAGNQIAGANNLINYSRVNTVFAGDTHPDHSRGTTQSINFNADLLPGYGLYQVCTLFNVGGTWSTGGAITSAITGAFCTSISKGPPAPTYIQDCNAGKVRLAVNWPAGGAGVRRYSVQIDNDNWVGGYWYRGPISPPAIRSINDAPTGFVGIDGAVDPLVFNPGSTYNVRILYDRSNNWTDVFNGGSVSFTARSDCSPPPPVPPAPTITPTCTSNRPTFTISWNSVGGLSPTSFTVDADDNDFAGGTGWLYKDVSSAGPGPYSVSSAPNTFGAFGPGPVVPLTPGAQYQFRINYRSAFSGSDVVSTVGRNTARSDCAPVTPPAPTLTPTCTTNQPTVDISWNAVGGLTPTSFTVDLDNDNFAGGWLFKDVPSAGPGPYTVTSAPNTFGTFGVSPPSVPLAAGAPYQVRINYRAAASGSDVLSTVGTFTSRADCAPIPTPPAPTLTPTCTANNPTVTINWNAVGGLAPSSFTVDLDNDNFAGGWLYRDVSSAGAGPYITTGPGGFSSFGVSPPLIPLAPDALYQVRINYRAAASGADVYSSPGSFRSRADCAPVTPPAPTLTPTCTAYRPTVTISWNAVGGLTPTSFTVDLDNDNFAGGWLFRNTPSAGPGPYSVMSAPNGFGTFGASPPSVPLSGGSSYQARVNYRAAASGADVYSLAGSFIARSDCAPPTPPAPTLTPTCTTNQPTVDISWNAVGGLTPTSFTVDFDNDNFAGGWLYKDVPSAGAGPYTVTSAPNTFGTFGVSPPSVPLAAGAPYQVRINYRAAASGSDVLSTVANFTARSDCVPPPAITCISINPASVEASPGAYDLQVLYRNAVGNAALVGANVRVTIATSPSQSTMTAVAPDLPGDGSTRLAPLLNITTPTTGEYAVSLTFTGGNSPAAPVTCPSLKVSYWPYFRIFGGDIIAGIKPPPICTGWLYDPDSGIYAFGDSSSGRGAGTQLAAYALGQIEGLISGTGKISSTGAVSYGGANGLLPKYLTFANNGAVGFGGTGGLASCPYDYFKDSTALTPVNDTSVGVDGIDPSTMNGNYYYNLTPALVGPISAGGLKIKGATINVNKKITIYVNGDVTLCDDIKYSTGGWDVGKIPSLYVIAKGNIYVQAPGQRCGSGPLNGTNGVEQLDGVYIAQPSAPNTGRFYSCADVMLATFPVTSEFINSKCNSKLTVNGSVIAQQLRLFRILGTRYAGTVNEEPASTNIAEVFSTGPETWLTIPAPFKESPIDTYNAITGLQPIL